MAKRKRVTNPENLEERRIFARKLIRAGRSRTAIHDELKTNFGIGLGATWINEEIRRLKTYKATKTPPLTNGHSKPKKRKLIDHEAVQAMQAADALQITIPADPRLVAALLTTKQPFEFDGKSLVLR